MDIIKNEDKILIKYTPDNGLDWIYAKFKNNESIQLRGTFNFTKEQIELYDDEEEDFRLLFGESIYFKLASLENNYYKIDKDVLGIDYDLYIFKEIELNIKLFISMYNISIFKRVFSIVKKDLFIGGEKADFELAVWKELSSKFPNYYELKKYTSARIDRILSNYVDYSGDYRYKYETYINKKDNIKIINRIEQSIQQNELDKYTALYKKLKYMLDNDESYSEKIWQSEILEIIMLLYPKYLKVFKEVPFRDVYNKKTRRLDYMLVDASGFIDIVEIKKPHGISIVSKSVYRDNHVPLRELSGTIMQIEKYIFYLNKWGIKGEDSLTDRYSDKLPDKIKIKIVNPSGIVIMGRSNNLNERELGDFEVIKRKYKNIVEIYTYDDLLFRLENIILKWNGRL